MALRAAAPLRMAATPLGVGIPSAAASQSSGSSGSGGAAACAPQGNVLLALGAQVYWAISAAGIGGLC